MPYIAVKHVGNRYKVYSDDTYIGPLCKSDIVRLSLEEDQEVSQALIEEIKDIMYRRASNSSMTVLGQREASKGDIISKLKLKEYTDETIEHVIDMLYKYNYLNDSRYIESYIRSNIEKKSRACIKRELSMKDVDMSYVEVILDELYDETGIDNESIIKETIAKRFGNLDFSDDKNLRRVVSYMARRGFKPGEVMKYISDLSDA